jgi:hypothetical protein
MQLAGQSTLRRNVLYVVCQLQLRRKFYDLSTGLGVADNNFQRRKRSPRACFITWPPTSEIDLVSGMSLGQTSTQFWA